MPNKRIESYFFSDDGKIIKDGKEIVPVDGNVKLELSFSDVLADAAKLFVIARSEMLDLEAYKHITIFFNDENKNNFAIENIEYFFSPSLECIERKNFYVIPGFTAYAIDQNGCVVNRKTGKMKKWSISKGNERKNITGGYRICGGNHDNGGYRLIQRHRIFGLVFFPPDKNPKKMWINHINGIPGDDDFDNLEWATPGENIKHAYRTGLCTASLVPFFTRDVSTGHIERYRTIAEYVEIVGCSFSGIHGRLQKPEVAFEGLQFKRDDGSEWPELKRTSKGKPEEIRIVGRNVFTNEQFVFANIAEASEKTGFTGLAIAAHFKQRRIAPMNGWNFRFASENESFPNHCALNLKTYKVYPNKPPMPIISECGKFSFLGIKEFARYISKSVSQASVVVRKKQLVDGTTFRQHRRDEDLGKPIELWL